MCIYIYVTPKTILLFVGATLPFSNMAGRGILELNGCFNGKIIKLNEGVSIAMFDYHGQIGIMIPNRSYGK